MFRPRFGTAFARHCAHWALVSCLFIGLAGPSLAAGYEMFATEPYSTGEKPQSKLWFHDGAYWGILQGPDGVAFYELVGDTWEQCVFADAELASSGQADVKWTGSRLLVLVYASTCWLYEYTYESTSRVWLLASGFPVRVPNPSGSETMVLEQDSTGRLWTTTRGGTEVHVYYSTSTDHRTWSSTPVVLRTGVNADDISSIVAFGGNKVGVFWSDQNRDQFGFCVHQDTDAPSTWSAVEVVASGSGLADDHINLAYDSTGRVYAITKDDVDAMRVHRRGATGGWTTKTNVISGTGTRGIIMVSESDSKVYILYTRWGVSPETIEYRVADIATLTFGGTTTFISTSGNLNNVTGLKQILPAGSMVAVAEDGNSCWYNRLGAPPVRPPDPPQNVTATLLVDPLRVQVAWSAPPSGTPDGYDIYRSVDGGDYTKLNGSLLGSTSYTDTAPPLTLLCYQVRAVDNGLTSAPSDSVCADNTPLAAPGPPLGLVASLQEIPTALDLAFDEGSGQQAADASGNNHHARLGSSTGSDPNDPAWVAGVTDGALQFDGSNDYLEISDSPALDMPGSFTVEAWVRYTSGTGTIVNKGSTGSRTYRLQVTSGGDVDFRWDTTSGSSRTVVAADAIPDAAWHHVACVYDQTASQNRIYVDGTLAGSASATGTPSSNSQALHVGARYSSGMRDFLNGALDEVRITPTTLYTQDFQPALRWEPLAAPGVRLATPERKPTGQAMPETAAQRVYLAWQAPASGVPAVSYHVYRSVDNGAEGRLDMTTVTTTAFEDASPVVGWLCYRVTAVNVQGLEGAASEAACVRLLPSPPSAPRDLAASLVIQAPGLPPGVAAYFFDEGQGQVFADSTGNGHTGQLGSQLGIDAQDPRWAVGVFDRCLRFDGIDDRARIEDAADLRFTGSFTLEGWICPAGSSTRCVLAKGVSPSVNFALALDDSGRVLLHWDDAGGAPHGALSQVVIPTGTWHHVAGVYDQEAGESRIFVDGLLAAAAADSGVPATSAYAVRLGSQQTASAYTSPFAGCIDLVRLSSGALYTTDFVPPRTYVPAAPRRIDVTWQAPLGSEPAGYKVYRNQDGGSFVLLAADMLPLPAYSDLVPPSGMLCYRVAAVDSFGQEGAASEAACVQLTTTDGPPPEAVAAASNRAFVLQALPNPARGWAHLLLHLPSTGAVRVEVFNLRGQRVASIEERFLAAGRHVLRWDGRTSNGDRAANGVYWLVASSGQLNARAKLVLVR